MKKVIIAIVTVGIICIQQKCSDLETKTLIRELKHEIEMNQIENRNK